MHQVLALAARLAIPFGAAAAGGTATSQSIHAVC
jgi:hypothetical protein